MRVFEHWGEFETEENAKAFLYTVARRIYLDHCKHQKMENQYQNRVNGEELEEYDFLKEVTQQERCPEYCTMLLISYLHRLVRSFY